jgi:hypothetical protein
VSRGIVRSLWGYHHVDWCFLGSSKASRGILLMWDMKTIEKIEEYVCLGGGGEFIVACSLRNVENRLNCFCGCL